MDLLVALLAVEQGEYRLADPSVLHLTFLLRLTSDASQSRGCATFVFLPHFAWRRSPSPPSYPDIDPPPPPFTLSSTCRTCPPASAMIWCSLLVNAVYRVPPGASLAVKDSEGCDVGGTGDEGS